MVEFKFCIDLGNVCNLADLQISHLENRGKNIYIVIDNIK